MLTESSLPFRASKAGAQLFVRATPKSARERIDGIAYDTDGRAYLKVYTNAPAEDGKANEAIIVLLSKALNLPKTCITLKTGGTHRLKCFELEGISIDEITFFLQTCLQTR